MGAHTALDAWLTAPAPGAAGQQGLYRILYATFYLWHLSFLDAALLDGLPDAHLDNLLLLRPVPAWVSGWVLELGEAALVAALVFLLCGLGTRYATAAVLGLGLALEAHYFSFVQEHGNAMLTVYIPLFMLIAGDWGATYSADARLRRARGAGAPDPASSAAPYVLPRRAVLLLLAGLIFTAGFFKAVGGTWLQYPDVLGHLFLLKNVEAAREGLMLNPLAPLVAATPALSQGLQLATLALELSFPLALLGRTIRNAYLASMLIFHSLNALWLVVTFTPFVIVYGLFIDWEGLRRRALPRPFRRGGGAGRPARLVAGVTLAALAAATLWNTGLSPRPLLNAGGAINWQTLWIPILPLALGWLGVSVAQLVRSAAARPRHVRGVGP